MTLSSDSSERKRGLKPAPSRNIAVSYESGARNTGPRAKPKVDLMTHESKLTIDEKTIALFQVDPLLPAQYFETLRSRARLAPEILLMLAVLEDAVTCIQKYASFSKGREKRWFRETIDWIATEDDEWVFSLNSICEAWDLDAGCLRKALTRMAQSESAKQCETKAGKSQPSMKRRQRERMVRA